MESIFFFNQIDDNDLEWMSEHSSITTLSSALSSSMLSSQISGLPERMSSESESGIDDGLYWKMKNIRDEGSFPTTRPPSSPDPSRKTIGRDKSSLRGTALPAPC